MNLLKQQYKRPPKLYRPYYWCRWSVEWLIAMVLSLINICCFKSIISVIKPTAFGRQCLTFLSILPMRISLEPFNVFDPTRSANRNAKVKDKNHFLIGMCLDISRTSHSILDISRTFNTLNIKILISALENYGVPGININWGCTNHLLGHSLNITPKHGIYICNMT